MQRFLKVVLVQLKRMFSMQKIPRAALCKMTPDPNCSPAACARQATSLPQWGRPRAISLGAGNVEKEKQKDDRTSIVDSPISNWSLGLKALRISGNCRNLFRHKRGVEHCCVQDKDKAAVLSTAHIN